MVTPLKIGRDRSTTPLGTRNNDKSITPSTRKIKDQKGGTPTKLPASRIDTGRGGNTRPMVRAKSPHVTRPSVSRPNTKAASGFRINTTPLYGASEQGKFAPKNELQRSRNESSDHVTVTSTHGRSITNQFDALKDMDQQGEFESQNDYVPEHLKQTIETPKNVTPKSVHQKNPPWK